MNAQPHHPRTHPLTAARTAGARLGRLAAVRAAITASLLASAAAAFAGMNPIPTGPGGYVGDPYIGIMGTGPIAPVPATTVRVITTGGMAAWQITLIALAAALVAATAAVLADRARTARRSATV